MLAQDSFAFDRIAEEVRDLQCAETSRRTPCSAPSREKVAPLRSLFGRVIDFSKRAATQPRSGAHKALCAKKSKCELCSFLQWR